MIIYIRYNSDLYRIKFTHLQTEVRMYHLYLKGWYIVDKTFPLYEEDFLSKNRIPPEQIDKEIKKMEMMRSLTK